MRLSRVSWCRFACGLMLLAGPAQAQILLANDDAFGVPYGEMLVSEDSVLDNDTLNGENARESGATAELVSGASHGLLTWPPTGRSATRPTRASPGSTASSTARSPIRPLPPRPRPR